MVIYLCIPRCALLALLLEQHGEILGSLAPNSKNECNFIETLLLSFQFSPRPLLVFAPTFVRKKKEEEKKRKNREKEERQAGFTNGWMNDKAAEYLLGVCKKGAK